MRGRPLQFQATARATGYVVVAAAIAATAFHFRHDGTGASAPVRMPTAVSDPLAPELARCQAIGMTAKDDAACEAAWAENRRRFFTYRPAGSGASTAPTDPQPAAKREGQ
jgi:conjugative transfer region protein TrbK